MFYFTITQLLSCCWDVRPKSCMSVSVLGTGLMLHTVDLGMAEGKVQCPAEGGCSLTPVWRWGGVCWLMCRRASRRYAAEATGDREEEKQDEQEEEQPVEEEVSRTCCQGLCCRATRACWGGRMEELSNMEEEANTEDGGEGGWCWARKSKGFCAGPGWGAWTWGWDWCWICRSLENTKSELISHKIKLFIVL